MNHDWNETVDYPFGPAGSPDVQRFTRECRRCGLFESVPLTGLLRSSDGFIKTFVRPADDSPIEPGATLPPCDPTRTTFVNLRNTLGSENMPPR